MAIEGYSMGTLGAFVGKELGVSAWVEVDQARIDAFAQCTGDHQWIHVDVERARRESPFGGTIAHGYLTLSLLAGKLVEMGVVPGDARAAVNYGVEKTRFLAPVKAGVRVRNRVRLMSADSKGDGRVLLRTENTMEIEGEAKPAMVAEALALVMA
ncbi:MaoC family dehydratase [Cupriavidus oxalaticus]|jgi:acyl dehydratase|uniref:Enoyl-CoA hydratase 1 n=1 Tax=Cupriavidus oxalaticus TaxID=96344 RepID=A0A375FWN0_9BURK|nr:MaoC family dehydratase [Cupriavidus oxalaticus]QEZ43093.1 MaoC family dehydratase [Cupriavidus oxalaticus]QRQ85499.1 MaoC family dehydratase [Cupriavidus oxalaticus]QRQ90413.1 MaoC family dehydratase [Cupriavidus oxalaticus]WQD84928.1 MaoC family dehydratase [Cupriavidus oxalaticus]SPC09862.1 putative enoyl-CoA hydratase 1 [Cupriavidus oxalaticus]